MREEDFELFKQDFIEAIMELQSEHNIKIEKNKTSSSKKARKSRPRVKEFVSVKPKECTSDKITEDTSMKYDGYVFDENRQYPYRYSTDDVYREGKETIPQDITRLFNRHCFVEPQIIE